MLDRSVAFRGCLVPAKSLSWITSSSRIKRLLLFFPTEKYWCFAGRHDSMSDPTTLSSYKHGFHGYTIKKNYLLTISIPTAGTEHGWFLSLSTSYIPTHLTVPWKALPLLPKATTRSFTLNRKDFSFFFPPFLPPSLATGWLWECA